MKRDLNKRNLVIMNDVRTNLNLDAECLLVRFDSSFRKPEQVHSIVLGD